MSEYSVQDLQDNLDYLNETKRQIRQAIIDKEQEVPANTPFRDYADKIRDIETGIDTSDATATAADILNPETAYVNGVKITGSIIPTITTIDKQVSITSTSTTSGNILDINTKYNLIAIGTMHSSNSVTIRRFDGDSIGDTLLTITSATWNGRTLSCMRFSKDVDTNGKLNLWFVCGPNSNNCYVSVAQLDLNTYTLTTSVHVTSGYTRDNRQCAGEVNPVYNNVIGVGLQGNAGSVTSYNIALAILKYDCNAGTLTRLAYDQAYGLRMVNTSYYEFEWSSDGSVCMVAGPRFGSDTQGIIGRYYNSTNTYSRVKDFSGSVYFCMWNGSYYFLNNTLVNLSGTTVKTYSQLTSSTYKWTYDNVLFCWSGSIITAYDINTTSLDLTLLGSYSVGSIKGEAYGGSIQRPYSNDNCYICNSNSVLYKIKILSGEIISELNRDGMNYKYLDPTISTATSSVLSGKKYYDGSGLKTGTMTNYGSKYITPSASTQTFSSGYYSRIYVYAAKIENTNEYSTCLSLTDEILE